MTQVPHKRLPIAQCGAKKLTKPAIGLELYRGPLWQTIRQHAFNYDGSERCRIAVLSAEYGLFPAKDTREPYDRKMTAERAGEILGWLAPHFGLFEGIERVCIVGGNIYAGLAAQLVGTATKNGLFPGSINLVTIVDQIGMMRLRLRHWLEADAKWPEPERHIMQGDMVVTMGKKPGRIGLVAGFGPGGRGLVQFVNNGRPVGIEVPHLRRATLEEIEASHLKGVGCNQAQEGVIHG